jgi:hypothetical protein
MPRIFFTGRKKIARKRVSVNFRRGRPPEFDATIDLSQHQKLPKTARVFVDAYNPTTVQRFDFGTVADCRPRDSLRLTSFDEWDEPLFRVRAIDVDRDAGAVVALCERIVAVEPEEGAQGGRSMLKLVPKPDHEMGGELWRLVDIGSYQLWYNKDVPRTSAAIKSKNPDVLGLILPAALRDILAREVIWDRDGLAEPTEWTQFAVSICGEPLPTAQHGDPPTEEALASWIDCVVKAFCQNRARFVQRMAEMKEVQQ